MRRCGGARRYDGRGDDGLAAETAASLCLTHPDYARNAARMELFTIYNQTPAMFSESAWMSDHRAGDASSHGTVKRWTPC